MNKRTFVAWVEPIARRDREGRAALLEFSRLVPAAAWLRPSPVDGWMCRDVLAHIAGDTGKWFSHLVHAALDEQRFDRERVGPGVDIDAINRRDVEARRSSSIADLISEIEADGEEHDLLLSRLTDQHEDFSLAEYLFSLGDLLGGNAAGNHGAHDLEHLEQLRLELAD